MKPDRLNAFTDGVVAIIMGFSGRSTVADSLKLEKIVGSADMTPALIAKEAKAAGLTNVDLPTVAVAGEQINSGPQARAFASYMRIHTLEATGGLTYSQLPRYATADGKGTNDAAKAAWRGRPTTPMKRRYRCAAAEVNSTAVAAETLSFAQSGQVGHGADAHCVLLRKPHPKTVLQPHREHGEQDRRRDHQQHVEALLAEGEDLLGVHGCRVT